jgi:cytochrome c-type biogenesis protein CcmH
VTSPATRRTILALAILIGGAAGAAAAPVDERTVHAIAADLRCVVCQSLSVADSPSETANQMRGIIRERLAAGDTPDQVRAYFVERYGQWILLAPPRRGFDLLVWIAPFAALAVGLVVVFATIRRWSRRARPARPETDTVDEATRARIAREMAEMDR